MENKRFITVMRQGNGFTDYYKEVIDTETGVHYFCWKNGYAGGITPLLDAGGKPVITSRSTAHE